MKEYIVVNSHPISGHGGNGIIQENLAKNVNAKIKQGWCTVGGIVAYSTATRTSSGHKGGLTQFNPDVTLCQAMEKEMVEKPKQEFK